MSKAHQNAAWRKLSRQRRAIARANDEVCAVCRQPFPPDAHHNSALGMTTGHPEALEFGGELLPPIDSLFVIHRRCHGSEGAAITHLKQGLGPGSRGGNPENWNAKRRSNVVPISKSKIVSFPARRTTPGTAEPVHTQPVLEGFAPGMPDVDRGLWDVPWISPLLDAKPESASLPRWMTVPHPRAVGSYGQEAVDWIRDEVGIELRWWQRLAMVRQLEHDADGTLVWRYIVESTPRRSGKSWRVRGTALWRLEQGDRFGEPQSVVFSGKDLPICKEIHRRAWKWADDRGWTVRKGMGNEEIENPEDGSRWLVRSQNGVYGYDAGLGQIDEGWAVPAAVVDEGLQPAMMDRSNPQLMMTSTAHRKATSLMLTRIAEGRDQIADPRRTLLLVWCAAPDADPQDEREWRAASPHWDEDRLELMRDRWTQIQSGRVVPDPDEPDPVEGFKAQYLNVWQEPSIIAAKGWPDGFADCPTTAGQEPPFYGVGALEVSQDRNRYGAALAVKLGDQVAVWTSLSSSIEQAVGWLNEHQPVTVLVGVSLKSEAEATAQFVVRPAGTAETRQATPLVQALAKRRALAHDHTAPLMAECLSARVAEVESGEMLSAKRSVGPISTIKAMAWAAWAAHTGIIDTEMPQIL